jgi:hypothetical protein
MLRDNFHWISTIIGLSWFLPGLQLVLYGVERRLLLGAYVFCSVYALKDMRDQISLNWSKGLNR